MAGVGRAHRTVRDAAKLVASQATIAMWALFFSAWLARALPERELAVWPVWIGLTAAVQSLSSLGVHNVFLRLVPEALASGRTREASATLRCGLMITVLVAALLSLALLPGSEMAARVFLNAPEMAGTVRVLVIAVFLAAVQLHLAHALYAVQDFSTLAVVRAAYRAAQGPVAVGLYLIFGIGGAVAALSIVAGVACAVSFAKLWPYLRVGKGIQNPVRLLSCAGPFCGVPVLAFLTNRVDYLVIGALTTPEMLAGYYVAYKLSDQLEQFTAAAGDVAVPKLAELRGKPDERVRGAFAKCTRYLLLVFVPLCVGPAVLGPALVRMYAGDRYASAGIILSALCVYVLVNRFYELHRATIMTLSPRWHLLALQGVGAILNPLALVLLVPLHAGLGAAAAKLLVFSALALFGYYLLTRRFRLVYDRHAALFSMGAGCLMAIPMAAAVYLWPTPWAALPAAAAGAGTYLWLLRHRLTEADADVLVGWLPASVREKPFGRRLSAGVEAFLVAPAGGK